MNKASKVKKVLSITLALISLSACSNKPETQPLAGGDKDAHGCIGSAGYLWCQKENKCVRPWKLAKDKNFDNTESEFNKYCGDSF